MSGRDSLVALVDLLGRRHALRLLLFLTGGSQPFGAMTAHVGAGDSQVSQRLRELREAGLIEVDEGGDYRLTPTGRRLQGVLAGVEHFAAEWSAMTPRQRNPRGVDTRGRGEP